MDRLDLLSCVDARLGKSLLTTGMIDTNRKRAYGVGLVPLGEGCA